MTESDRVEYKFKLNDSFEREVVSFLNSEGGRILIGVDDLGNPVGLPHADLNQLQIKDRIKNNILPSALEYCTISLEVVDGLEVVAVDVSSGLERPYYIRKFGMSPQGCFFRKGSSCEPMREDLIERMYAGRMKNTLRMIPSPNQGVSFRELQIYYEGIGRPLNSNFLSNLNLLTPDGDLNYSGYLLSDGSGVSIRFAKYEGESRVVLLENEEFGFCSLMRAFDRLFDRLSVENKTYARITDRRRVERRMVDSVALREAVLNAILHNDYSYSGSPKFEMFSNRLEITSIGGLPFGMTRDDFFSGVSLPRNPELMRIFRDLDYVEHLGSGIPRILEVYGCDAFVVSESFVRVVLPFAKPLTEADAVSSVSLPSGSMPFSSNDRLVISAIERDGSVTVKGISAETGFAVRKVERILARLKGLGVVVRSGARKDGRWVVDYDVYTGMAGGLIGGLEKDDGVLSDSKLEPLTSSLTGNMIGIGGGLTGGLTDDEAVILRELRTNPHMSLSSISKKIYLPRHRVEKVMNGLKEKGLVVRIGSARSGYWEVLDDTKEDVL